MRFCGIDVGQDVVYPVVLDLTAGRFDLAPHALEVGAALSWVMAHEPDAIAIDSPPRPNLGLLAEAGYITRHQIDLRGWSTDRRVCEWRLGIGGCYSTRGRPDACPAWMRTGMTLFAAFEQQQFQIDLGSGGEVFEIHPTFGFRSLVAIPIQNGLRVTCASLKRKRPVGSLGHRQRLELLAALLRRWDVALDERARTSLDWTDAMLGAAFGALRANCRTLRIDAPGKEEGAIVLASAPLCEIPEILGRPEQGR